MPSHLSNDDPAVNRPLPTLPHETWTHIFSYLQYQHSSTAQPSWEPWLVYRRVNRHFKDLVEAEYARHFLRGCAIVLDAGNDHIDCGETGIKGDTITRPRILRYEHVGFSNEAHAPEAMSEGDRFAIFRSKLDNAVETASIAQTQALSQPPRHSYHPNILMHLRTGATDLLPSDLRFISSKNDHTKSWTFIFDWRMYFCTLFNEVKDAAAFRDECWQKKLTVRYPVFIEEERIHPATLSFLILASAGQPSVRCFSANPSISRISCSSLTTRKTTWTAEEVKVLWD